MKPRLLDLFCGAGGAAVGYHRAGFDVVGVDIKPQPNYPFGCYREDAFRLLDSFWHPYPVWKIEDFAAIHASPPCQTIARTREELEATGLPYVIENVASAPLCDAVMLCGTGFGLDVQRHRYFESNVTIMSPGCAHGRNGARFPAATNRGENTRRTVEVGVWRIPLEVQQAAMGIDWMTLEELSEAIPPAYTEHIGHYLMAEVRSRLAA